MKYQHFLMGLFLLGLGSLLVPSLPAPVGLIAYAAFALAIAWSALKHRSAGWCWGVLLTVLLLTLPLWVMGAYSLYERWRQ